METVPILKMKGWHLKKNDERISKRGKEGKVLCQPYSGVCYVSL